MQDRFRFRAWNTITKTMKEVAQLTFDEDVMKSKNYKKNKTTVHIVYQNHIILMQSTGLKDKNGKLIYEGDIVKITNTTPYGDKIEQVCTVEFSDGCFWARAKTITVILYHEDNEYEVIGNIYANKELLKEQK